MSVILDDCSKGYDFAASKNKITPAEKISHIFPLYKNPKRI